MVEIQDSPPMASSPVDEDVPSYFLSASPPDETPSPLPKSRPQEPKRKSTSLANKNDMEQDRASRKPSMITTPSIGGGNLSASPMLLSPEPQSTDLLVPPDITDLTGGSGGLTPPPPETHGAAASASWAATTGGHVPTTITKSVSLPLEATGNNIAASPGVSETPAAMTTSRSFSTLTASPTSPTAPPKRHGLGHHRRTSSHIVKETLQASLSEDERDGSRWLNNQYKIGEEIGKGSFGSVLLGVDMGENANGISRSSSTSTSMGDQDGLVPEARPPGTQVAIKEFSKSRLRRRRQSEMIRAARAGRGRGRALPPIRHQSRQRGSTATTDHARSQSAEEREDAWDLIKSEIAIMKKIDHPNLVKLYEVLDVENDDSLYMVIELCKRGPIIDLKPDTPAEPLDEDTARNYFRQVILGIEYLHHNDIVHHDIKPDNILVCDENTCKLVDFGVSQMFVKHDDDMMNAKTIGSPAFMSPEVCVSKSKSQIHARATDIWAMGVTLFCLVVGKLPFLSDNLLELQDKIMNDPAPVPKDLSPELGDLLNLLLKKNPDERIDMNGLREHPWITRNGTDPLISVEQNVSQFVEITEGDFNNAFRSVSGVLKAVSKIKKLVAQRRSMTQEEVGNVMTNNQFTQSRSTTEPEAIKSRTASEDPVENALSNLTLRERNDDKDQQQQQQLDETNKADKPKRESQRFNRVSDVIFSLGQRFLSSGSMLGNEDSTASSNAESGVDEEPILSKLSHHILPQPMHEKLESTVFRKVPKPAVERVSCPASELQTGSLKEPEASELASEVIVSDSTTGPSNARFEGSPSVSPPGGRQESIPSLSITSVSGDKALMPEPESPLDVVNEDPQEYSDNKRPAG